MVTSGDASHKATPMVMEDSAEASTALRAVSARSSADCSTAERPAAVGPGAAHYRIAGSTSRR
jgi:hypothetical protein